MKKSQNPTNHSYQMQDHIEEAVVKLEDIHGMSVPIADKISSLADNCREMLEQELASTSRSVTIRE